MKSATTSTCSRSSESPVQLRGSRPLSLRSKATADRLRADRIAKRRRRSGQTVAPTSAPWSDEQHAGLSPGWDYPPLCHTRHVQ